MSELLSQRLKRRSLEESALRVNKLNVKLSDETIIEDLSFEIRKREIFAIIGANGGGKTILLRTLLGFIPHKGDIVWDKSLEVKYMPSGLSPLQVNIPITIKEFFELKRIDKEKVKKVLSSVGLENISLGRKIRELSFGQFIRLLVAWTVADISYKDTVLILDEPTTGVDIEGKKMIAYFLYQLWKEKNLTIIVATHDLADVKKYATKVLGLYRRKIFCGTPSEVLTPKNLTKIYGGG